MILFLQISRRKTTAKNALLDDFATCLVYAHQLASVILATCAFRGPPPPPLSMGSPESCVLWVASAHKVPKRCSHVGRDTSAASKALLTPMNAPFASPGSSAMETAARVPPASARKDITAPLGRKTRLQFLQKQVGLHPSSHLPSTL